jgi:predicted membrane-bound mannosyltransferase
MKEVFLKPLIALAALDLLLVWLISTIVKLRATSQTAVTRDSQSSLSATAYLFAVAGGVAGLTFRLYGFNRSLWLDEFGTLWAIEGSFSQMWERANAFQGQSPFYYSLARLFVHLFVESEITLRFLSFILGLSAVYGVYLLGRFLDGRNSGLIAASLLWITPSMVQASADARPYALA